MANLEMNKLNMSLDDIIKRSKNVTSSQSGSRGGRIVRGQQNQNRRGLSRKDGSFSERSTPRSDLRSARGDRDRGRGRGRGGFSRGRGGSSRGGLSQDEFRRPIQSTSPPRRPQSARPTTSDNARQGTIVRKSSAATRPEIHRRNISQTATEGQNRRPGARILSSNRNQAPQPRGSGDRVRETSKLASEARAIEANKKRGVATSERTISATQKHSSASAFDLARSNPRGSDPSSFFQEQSLRIEEQMKMLRDQKEELMKLQRMQESLAQAVLSTSMNVSNAVGSSEVSRDVYEDEMERPRALIVSRSGAPRTSSHIQIQKTSDGNRRVGYSGSASSVSVSAATSDPVIASSRYDNDIYFRREPDHSIDRLFSAPSRSTTFHNARHTFASMGM